jgi:hypothetical protein
VVAAGGGNTITTQGRASSTCQEVRSFCQTNTQRKIQETCSTRGVEDKYHSAVCVADGCCLFSSALNAPQTQRKTRATTDNNNTSPSRGKEWEQTPENGGQHSISAAQHSFRPRRELQHEWLWQGLVRHCSSAGTQDGRVGTREERVRARHWLVCMQTRGIRGRRTEGGDEGRVASGRMGAEACGGLEIGVGMRADISRVPRRATCVLYICTAAVVEQQVLYFPFYDSERHPI